MKTMMKNFLLLLMVLVSVALNGQDPNYTQFFNNPQYYNPAYSGLYTGVRAGFSFRDQWPALPYDFQAYNFEADMGDRNLPGSGGLGLFLNTNNEGIGFIKNINLGLSLAVRIPFSKLSVGQVGVKVSWLQKSVNWDDFTFSDALSERYGDIYQTGFIRPEQNVRNMADFGVGGIYQFSNEVNNFTGTFGFAVDHLFEPDQSFLQTAKAPLPRKYVAHGDLIFAVGSSSGFNSTNASALKFNPGVVYQSQGGVNSLQAGLNLTKFGLNLGLWYKGSFGNYNNSMLGFMAGYAFEVADNLGLKFTYSYDMQMAGALQGTGGAHEISLIIDFNSESVFGGLSRSGRMKGGHFEGQTPWECATF
ncbi:MAG: PorP/SprF family type IX secretion system membrane protein [Bacteroidetes bacterium]|nr:PorP/SprF family type IX secretion system membrane protein [Bacteroidota bacterium]